MTSNFVPAHKKGPYGFSGLWFFNAHTQSSIGTTDMLFCFSLPGASSRSLLHVCEQRRLWRYCDYPGRLYDITKTCPYNFDPLKPHFHIVKLGFTGVYIIFLFLLKNIDCGYSLEPPRRGGSNEYPQSMFWAEIWKISEFLYLKIFRFWRWKFLYI